MTEQEYPVEEPATPEIPDGEDAPSWAPQVDVPAESDEEEQADAGNPS